MFKFVRALLEYDELKEKNHRMAMENIGLYNKIKSLNNEINYLKFEKVKTCKDCEYYSVENTIDGLTKEVTKTERCKLGKMILSNINPCKLFLSHHLLSFDYPLIDLLNKDGQANEN